LSRDAFHLQSNPCQHPIVILRDVSPDDLQALLSYMYNGEVAISEDRLKDFMRTAEMLQVEGLADGANREDNEEDDEDPPATSLQEQRADRKRSGEEVTFNDSSLIKVLPANLLPPFYDDPSMFNSYRPERGAEE